MINYSNIIIRIDKTAPYPPVDGSNNFYVTDVTNSNLIYESVYQSRFSGGVWGVGNSIDWPYGGWNTLKTALETDNGWNGLYTITQVDNPTTLDVIIKSNIINTEFVILLTSGLTGVSFIINNFLSEVPELSIDNISFSAATIEDPCTHVKVEVTTNKIADVVTAPLLIDPNINLTFEFEYLRQSSDTVACQQTSPFEQTSAVFVTPDVLDVNNVTINVLESITGGTAIITVTNTNKLNIEYSLDDVFYQDGNILSGLSPNTYTVYIKDQYGCKVNKNFIVTGDFLAVTQPYEFVSSQNSIRYAKRLPPTQKSGFLDDDQQYEIVKYVSGDNFINVGATYNKTGEVFTATGTTPTTWTNGSTLRQISPMACNIYQNSDSLLSCEEYVSPTVRYKAVQLYNSCDIIKTQFKSNYDNIEVKTVDPNGFETILPLTKVTDNLQREDHRDATVKKLSSTTSGVYYTSGNLYDFYSLSVIGTYTLNGNLPEYGVIGNYVTIDGYGTHQIKDIIIDESVNARVLVFDFVYTGSFLFSSQIKKVKCAYSVANFEVYEFDVDMSFYINQRIRVKIHMDHPLASFPDVDYISEIIDVKILQELQLPEFLVEIEYYNTDNGEILYIGNDGNLRITHKIRVGVQSMNISSDPSTEIHKTDTTTILLTASNYEGDEFIFTPLPTEMARRLTNILMHKTVKINQIGYVSQDVPEVERLGESNLYRVIAKMTRTGKIFNTEIQGVGNEVPAASEVISLLTGQLGFIKS